jgi:transmembrane sensor
LHEGWEKALALGEQLDSLRSRGDPDLARRALLLPAQEGLSRRRAIKGLALLLSASAGAWMAGTAKWCRASAPITPRVSVSSDVSR